jgi:hypothetical protein
MGIYKTWESMLNRVSENSKFLSYKNTTVCEEWYNFQFFAQWYTNYINLLNPIYNYQIDKDIFQWNYKYKVYSPSTCCLIPDRLNNSLVGLHVNRYNHPELPVGVMPNRGKYSSYITINDKRKYLGIFSNPMEAFAVYKKEKEEIIHKMAEYYYKNNAILEPVFQQLMNINIEPF